MKRFFKGAGAVILAVILAAGGFYVGRRYSDRMNGGLETASPKQSVTVPTAVPSDGDVPSEDVPPELPAPPDDVEGAAERTVSKLGASAVSEGIWTRVAGSTLPENSGTLTVYTSAEKDSEGFLWDDSQKWVVEIDDGEGGFYTLYDQLVSNGMVYCDAATRDNGDVIVTVYASSGAGTVVTQYTKADGGYVERTVYNSGSVNRIFTSIPDYR